MRKLTSLTLSLIALSFFGVGLARQDLAITGASYVRLSNYTTYTLPSTIDLNDCSRQEIVSYYGDLDGRSLSGEDLLKALKPILKNGQRYHSYDSSDTVWKAYEITDRDWDLSPANEITNGIYDSSTNTITKYKYKVDGGDDPYCHLLYRNRDVVEARQTAWGRHGYNDGTDREHIWPKSRGFGKDSEGNEWEVPGARGDLHHLLPGDSYVNSNTHSNNAYGYVDRSKVKDDAGANYLIGGVTVVGGNYRGTSSTFGKTLGSNDVFEPQDCDKGDIARACFYMVARYNNLALDDDTCDAGNPNLFLEDTVDTTTIMSNSSTKVSVGILRDLLSWHKSDPVDEYEIHRNNLIYRNFDHNRNPFIDYPEWVDYIWGRSAYDEDTHRVIAYDSTPTGYVDLENDQIYGYRDGESHPLVPDDPEVHATWQKADSIAVGDEVVLVCEGAGAATDPNNAAILTGLYSSGNSHYGSHGVVEIECDERMSQFFDCPNAYTLLVGKGNQAGTYSLKNRDGDYLCYTGSSNTLAASATLDDNASWKISFEEGNAIITLYGTDASPRAIKWNNNSANYRFSTYTSSQRAIQLYKLDAEYEASQWADDFIYQWTGGCNPDGGYIESNMHWEDAATAFEGLARNTQALLKEQEEDSSILWSAVERYDYIVSKYGSSTFEDFMSRSPLPKASNQAADPLIYENKASFALIFAFICVGISLGSAVLILRRSRHE